MNKEKLREVERIEILRLIRNLSEVIVNHYEKIIQEQEISENELKQFRLAEDIIRNLERYLKSDFSDISKYRCMKRVRKWQQEVLGK